MTVMLCQHQLFAKILRLVVLCVRDYLKVFIPLYTLENWRQKIVADHVVGHNVSTCPPVISERVDIAEVCCNMRGRKQWM